MTTPARVFILLGAILCATAVAAGAFGAHALRNRLAPELLATYKTAVEYHFWHALGLILLGCVAERLPGSTLIGVAGWTMFGGIVIFSGSLYVLCGTGARWLGAVTPLGGLAFLVAWLLLAVAMARP